MDQTQTYRTDHAGVSSPNFSHDLQPTKESRSKRDENRVTSIVNFRKTSFSIKVHGGVTLLDFTITGSFPSLALTRISHTARDYCPGANIWFVQKRRTHGFAIQILTPLMRTTNQDLRGGESRARQSVSRTTRGIAWWLVGATTAGSPRGCFPETRELWNPRRRDG